MPTKTTTASSKRITYHSTRPKVNRATAARLYKRWLAGESKEFLEVEILSAPRQKGTLFSRVVQRHLGIDTTDIRSLARERDQLRKELTSTQTSFEKYSKL